MAQRTARETRANVATYGIAGDEGTGLHSPADGSLSLLAGGEVRGYVDTDTSVPIVVKKPLVARADAGIILSVANPFGVAAVVDRLKIDITTGSTGAATADAGVAADATTNSDTLIDGYNLQTTGLADNHLAATLGTNGKVSRKIGATEFVNIRALADCTGLVGTAHITFYRAD